MAVFDMAHFQYDYADICGTPGCKGGSIRKKTYRVNEKIADLAAIFPDQICPCMAANP